MANSIKAELVAKLKVETARLDEVRKASTNRAKDRREFLHQFDAETTRARKAKGQQDAVVRQLTRELQEIQRAEDDAKAAKANAEAAAARAAAAGAPAPAADPHTPDTNNPEPKAAGSGGKKGGKKKGKAKAKSG